ncbi:LacI family DNA-binding transcriptional regulator [Sphingosinicella terrae]|jgi:LacI family transcriptional regulator|uniref:LacI family DNA-binding transcriptional regulator n=1 Tax=Sphingosinicella terrae TaxID=2172047 RepID=UPI000E0DF25C|nr:LacI family DNA-binding transcriptional regulator [Sphingosinicella terrae]
MTRKTIDDVAALAGVSIKTVSRVLNDEPSVRADTRRRVEEAMAALNYQPSLHARSLAGRRSSLVGLVYDNPSANYVFAVQSGAIARCRESKLRLFIQSCDGLDDRLIGEVLAMVDQTHVDGLVVTPPLSSNAELLEALRRRRLPFVLIAPDVPVAGAPSVVMDDRAAAREMTEYLLGLGHRHIGVIAGHPDHGSSRLREAGWRDALLAHGEQAGPDLVAQGYNTAASGREAAHALLAAAERPTALFACNDDMAAGAILAAHELGLVLPDQLSIAGFDDTELAGLIWPPLTTIHQPVYDMAYRATELLVQLVRGEEAPATTRLDHRLVVRASTGPPRSRLE